MSQKLTTAQLDELKSLLLKRRDELQQEMLQNRDNLSAPSADEGGMVQRNVAREVQQGLTDMDAADKVRVDRALAALADGSYGQCIECGCAIPYERLKVEPQTEHCVACKGRLEQAAGQARPPVH
ncbi:MAG: TraR/DksA family transcriptional regulator [Pseudomonadota bacterium]|nr:TraR/DksA family transcriptional regulator [Pseudomonadota bacterium]